MPRPILGATFAGRVAVLGRLQINVNKEIRHMMDTRITLLHGSAAGPRRAKVAAGRDSPGFPARAEVEHKTTAQGDRHSQATEARADSAVASGCRDSHAEC